MYRTLQRRGASGLRRLAAEEPALERPEQLSSLEGRDAPLLGAVLLEHAHVVLESGVGGLEGVLELVALEDVVVASRLVARAQLRVDGAADGPHGAGLPLDPDQ